MRIYSPPAPPVPIMDEIVPSRVFTIRMMPSSEVIQQWSATLPKGDSVYYSYDHFSHVHSNKSELYLLDREIDPDTGEVLDDDLLAPIRYARDAVSHLFGKKHPKFANPGWTFSQLAGNVNDWLGFSELSTQRDLLIEWDGEKPLWNFQRAIPGAYPYAALWDMSSAYWQIWQRVKSPSFFLYDDLSKIGWATLPIEQDRRWKRMHKVLADPALKGLHVALVGSNVRGWKGKNSDTRISHPATVRYMGGEAQPPKPNAGALMPLSLLTIRCIYELCQIQSEMSSSIYSNVDCVATESNARRMVYWDQWGIKYKLKAEGVSMVYGVGNRAIGNDYTDTFFHARANDLTLESLGKRYANPHIHNLVLREE